MFKLAIVVGHNARAKGAYGKSPIKQYEYDFNSAVARLMHQNAGQFDLETKVFFRQAGLGYTREIDKVYGEVDAWGADAAIELHFNAFNRSTTGTETLTSGSNGSKIFAQAAQQEIVRLFDRTGNENRGVKTRKRNQRGGRSLHTSRAPTILVEPFFGDTIKDAELMDDIGKRALAEAYLRAAHKAFRHIAPMDVGVNVA